MALHQRYHDFQSAAKGWPEHGEPDSWHYFATFVHNPLPSEEWRYYLGDQLIGVGYVDPTPIGLSAIYFFYEPEQRHRSIGVYNVLRLIHETANRGLPHLYLGYYVGDCPSLVYKSNYRPNQVLSAGGTWVTLSE